MQENNDSGRNIGIPCKNLGLGQVLGTLKMHGAFIYKGFLHACSRLLPAPRPGPARPGPAREAWGDPRGVERSERRAAIREAWSDPRSVERFDMRGACNHRQAPPSLADNFSLPADLAQGMYGAFPARATAPNFNKPQRSAVLRCAELQSVMGTVHHVHRTRVTRAEDTGDVSLKVPVPLGPPWKLKYLLKLGAVALTGNAPCIPCAESAGRLKLSASDGGACL